MAKEPVQRFKVILLRFVLGCLMIPMCAALGSTQPCVTTKAASIADPADVSVALRRDGCLDAAIRGRTYDVNSARCVQGGDGCDFSTL